MKRILVDMAVHGGGLRRLQGLPGVSVTCVEPAEEPRVFPAEKLRGQQILFCTYPPLNLEEADALELIQVSSVGYEQLGGLELPGRGIRACNGRGLFDSPIAEWNVAMMINLARDLRGMIRNQERSVWDRGARFQAEIRDGVVGLWGYGGVGRETARLAKALGMRVHVLSHGGAGPRTHAYTLPGIGDPEGRLPDRAYRPEQALDFLGGLNFLILTMPQTKSTRGIVGARELRALPRGAFVLNPSRGPLIEEKALLAALREGWIAGAALDAHYHYPLPPGHPLWAMPNVLLTPHISGSTENPHYLERVWEIFTGNVERYVAGRPLLNELSGAELEDA